MTDLWQVRMVWRGPGGLPGTNTIYSSTGDSDVDDLRTKLGEFYDTWCTGNVYQSFNVTIPSAGDKIDSDTGGVAGIWTSGSPDVHSGTDTVDWAPDTTQVLVQLQTDLIVNGRMLHGRLFLPGLRKSGVISGNLSSDIRSAMQSAADDAFVGRLCVFSRTHNTFATVTATSVWQELAVLRSRRG